MDFKLYPICLFGNGVHLVLSLCPRVSGSLKFLCCLKFGFSFSEFKVVFEVQFRGKFKVNTLKKKKKKACVGV